MRLLLVYPPSSDPTYPYPSLPGLKSYLQDNGFEDTFLWDCNLDFHLELLKPAFVSEAYRRIITRKRKLEAKSYFTKKDTEEYERIIPSISSANWILDSINKSVNLSRSKDFFNYQLYQKARQCFEKFYALASAESYPARIDLFGYYPNLPLHDDTSIQFAIERFSKSLLGEVLTKRAKKAISYYSPDIIGFSITYRDQFIPSLFLTQISKRLSPRLISIWGGNYASRLAEVSASYSYIWESVDFFIHGDGELPLIILLEELNEKDPSFTKVPNLIWRDYKKHLHFSEKRFIANLNELHLPDYSDIDFGRYLSPLPVITLVPSRGCDWKKCNFCSYGVDQSINRDYREAHPEKVAEWMQFLSDKYEVKHFNFGVDTISSKWLSDFSDILISSGCNFFWQTIGRADKGWNRDILKRLGKAGCRLLLIGLESAVPSILEEMKKGIKVEKMDSLLKEAANSDIAITIQVMTGYPGENSQEAKFTLDYLIKNRNYISFVGISQFQFLRGSKLFKEASKSSFEILLPENFCPAQLEFDYKVKKGLSRKAARDFIHKYGTKVNKYFNIRSYPYLESGASSHTLIAFSNMQKDEIIKNIRDQKSHFTLLKAPNKHEWTVNKASHIKFDIFKKNIEVNSEGKVKVKIPLKEGSNHVTYSPKIDSYFIINREVKNFLNTLDKQGIWFSGNIEPKNDDYLLMDLINGLAKKGLIVIKRYSKDLKGTNS